MALGVPVVSGNVSFYNETDGRADPADADHRAGRAARRRRATTRRSGSRARATSSSCSAARARSSAAASTWRVVHGLVRGTPPWIDLAVEMQVQRVCLQAIREGLVRSAHDVSRGRPRGRAGRVLHLGPDGAGSGAEIEMEGAIRPDAWLFGESQSRILLSLRRKHLGRAARAGARRRRAAHRARRGARPAAAHRYADRRRRWRSCAAPGRDALAAPDGRRTEEPTMARSLPRGVRHRRGLRPSGSGQPRLPRPLRPAAPRPGGRRHRRRRTATLLLSHRGLGLVADVFNQEIIQRLEGAMRHRPQPLLHHRPDAAQEHAAVRRRVRRTAASPSRTTATWSTPSSCASSSRRAARSSSRRSTPR